MDETKLSLLLEYGHLIYCGFKLAGLCTYRQKGYSYIWSEWRLTVIAATVRIALVDILDLSEVDIPAGVFLHPVVGWG